MPLISKEFRRKLLRRFSGPVLTRVLYLIIRLLRLTMRIEVRGGEILADFARRSEGYIGVFWHGRLLMIPFAYPGRRMHVLIGTHRDGQLIADIVGLFGFGLVRGSSSKGGQEALREMVRLLADDIDLAITPDGPRGPSEVAKPGVAQVARLSGKAVVPVGFSATRAWRFASWDRFLVPKPFSRGVFVVGEPLRWQHGEDLEEFRRRIETALRQATDVAEASCTAAGGRG
ncbi:MAG TPA: lysophospholipid acyltransferase family protein [Geobacteraceae bacterium]